MTQQSLLDIPEPRRKVAKAVPRSSRLTYQAEHARLDARSDEVKVWLCGWAWTAMLADHTTEPTAAELALYARDVENAYPSQSWDWLKLHVRRGLSDLQAAGVVEKAGDRPCRVSRRTCATWKLKTR